MKRPSELVWELLKSSDNLRREVWRASVPGGWLVYVSSDSLTFLPDSGHEWDGGSVKKAKEKSGRVRSGAARMAGMTPAARVALGVAGAAARWGKGKYDPKR